MNPMMEPPPPFELNDEERRSLLWLRLSKHLEEELSIARIQNDAPGKGKRETAHLRGRIDQLKMLLRLNEPTPRIT